ncbi:MAG TPA: DUF502 domain-containing protein [Vicinamibacterales bacterium]|jgi:uncharacterized membrane protein
MATPRAVLWLRRRFIAGFFVAVPLIISVAALLWIFQIIDGLTDPVYQRWLGRQVPGLGLATTAAFVLVVGVVASNVLGKRLLSRAEGYLVRVPVFGTIYSPVKQLLAAFSPENESGLKRVVMVEDSCGGLRMGFVTKEFELDTGTGLRPFAAVYLPTNNLYLGDIYVYPRDALVLPDITVEEGVKIFLTGGMAIADRLLARRP